MKIPASKVPAQVWANKVERWELGKLDSLDTQLYERWERSKQVYRVDRGIWETAIVEDDTELPASALCLLPFDCLFLQHRQVFVATDEFCSDGQIYRNESAVGIYGYFIVKGTNGDSNFPDGHLIVVPLMDESASIAEIKRLSDSHSVYEDGFDDSLGRPWWIPLKATCTIGEVASNVREDMDVETDEVSKGDAEYFMVGGEGGFTEKDLADASVLSLNRVNKELSRKQSLQVGNVLGSLLYIVSKYADVKTVYVPAKSRPRKSKQTDCTVHEVGYNVSYQLERVRRVYQNESNDATNEAEGRIHRHVTSHVRRAHWHGYWTGPKDNPTGLEIKWIAPIIVNGDEGELSGNVHVVSKRS